MGRGKLKQKRKLKLKRDKRKKQGKIVRFTLANSGKKFKGLKDNYAYQSNMHNLVFKDASIENVNYRSSIITNCNFRNAKLIGVDFIGVNLKNTNFQNATFENVIFFNVNLKGTNFQNATFKNVTFISTNLKNAKNLIIDIENIKILNQYPNINLKPYLKDALSNLSNCSQIYKYHTLHVNKSKLNMWFISLLLSDYSQTDLSRAFKALGKRKDKRGFYTIYSIKKFLDSYLKRI